MMKAIALVVSGMLAGGGTAALVLKRHYEGVAEEEIATARAEYKKENTNLKEQNIALMDEIMKLNPTAVYNGEQPGLDKKIRDAYKATKADKPLSEDDILNLSAQDLIKDLDYSSSAFREDRVDNVPNPPMHDDEDRPHGFKMYDRTTDNFNPADEERSFDVPYVVSLAEFTNDEEDFDKITITYFETDDTLIDERDETLGIENSVGQANLLRFGVGSESPDVVYIRNETLKIDFEVCRNLGSYTQTVLGIPEWNSKDIAQPKPRVKKMRDRSD